MLTSVMASGLADDLNWNKTMCVTLIFDDDLPENACGVKIRTKRSVIPQRMVIVVSF
jgi:hypothetical protein